MADWTAFSYIEIFSFGYAPHKASGVLAADGYASINTTPKPPWTATGTVELDGTASFSRTRGTPYLLHGVRELFELSLPYFDVDTGLNVPGGAPLSTRLENGMGGRTVPWGILTGIAEVDEGDVRTWTATSGTNAGRTVGVALENPRVSISLEAVFLRGVEHPARGSIFFFKKSNGEAARLICLKVTHLWTLGGWRAVQVEGTQWEGSLTTINPN